MMNKEKTLASYLSKYSKSDMLPMHMPGHKRKAPRCIRELMSDIYSIDVTETHDTDHLYAADGILKECLDYASSLYNTDASYYSINGSTGGILSAIRACMCRSKSKNSHALVGANSHISTFHAMEICGIAAEYIKPPTLGELPIAGAISPSDIKAKLDIMKSENSLPAFVIITSPTYDGIISDIEAISSLVHSYDLPLIVDSAHGSHMHWLNKYVGGVKPAIDCGADIVIESTHKMLPALTQTALVHVRSDIIACRDVYRQLTYFNSSSPSYVLMASIDACLRYMDEDARDAVIEYKNNIDNLRDRLGKLDHIKLWKPSRADIENKNVYEIDKGKLLIYCDGITGPTLNELLYKRYHIEAEMAAGGYVLLLTAICDTKESLDRIYNACKDMDSDIEKTRSYCSDIQRELDKKAVSLNESLKKISGKRIDDYIYVYPPGIPIVKPGNIITSSIAEGLKKYIACGCNIEGL